MKRPYPLGVYFYRVRSKSRARQYDRAIRQLVRLGWYSADTTIPRLVEKISHEYLSRPLSLAFPVLHRHDGDMGLARAEIRLRWHTLRDLALAILDEDTADADLSTDEFAALQRQFYEHLGKMAADGLLWD